jgi:Holliday junction DNA helicase RuvA
MIAYLRGPILDKGADSVVIDVHGVGYRVTVSQTSMAALPEVGASVQLRIHTHVREDALALFGFATSEEEELFHHLTAVSGVGPKLALNILSGMQPQELAYAIAHDEVARLTKIGGVGKKTAERLVVELADKLKGSTLLLQRGGPAPAGRTRARGADDLVSALTNLGYRPADAERAASAAREAQPSADLETQLRAALQMILAKAV